MTCIKNSCSAFQARVKTYTHTKNYTRTFTGSHLRAVTDANDDDDDDNDDNAGRHSTITRATYCQLINVLTSHNSPDY